MKQHLRLQLNKQTNDSHLISSSNLRIANQIFIEHRTNKKVVVEQLDAANSQIDQVKSNVSGVKGLVEVQLDKVEKAFDTRVGSALNRIGIASKHDVETLSAKLEELTALLERVARKH